MVFKNLERGKEEEIQDDGAEGDVLQVFYFFDETQLRGYEEE